MKSDFWDATIFGVDSVKQILSKRYDYMGGFNRLQFRAWGVAWPPPANWRQELWERCLAEQRAERASREALAAA